MQVVAVVLLVQVIEQFTRLLSQHANFVELFGYCVT
jgi:hypothetical protein